MLHNCYRVCIKFPWDLDHRDTSKWRKYVSGIFCQSFTFIYNLLFCFLHSLDSCGLCGLELRKMLEKQRILSRRTWKFFINYTFFLVLVF